MEIYEGKKTMETLKNYDTIKTDLCGKDLVCTLNGNSKFYESNIAKKIREEGLNFGCKEKNCARNNLR